MAAAMNGMALHGGVIPYSGTFLVFSDYCRPSLRLAALMGERVIHVMTHDSIGLGEDGPTHEPVEHLAALRAIPNMHVFRPCDAVETLECWQLALENKDGPSVLALTRQNLPQLRKEMTTRNLCAGGAYEIASSIAGQARVSIFATGSEVSIACEAKKLLDAQGVLTRVVSVPSDGTVRRTVFRGACRHHRQRAGQGRGRSGRASGLGRDHRRGRRLRRNDRLWRQRALSGSLPALRHHAGGHRSGRKAKARPELIREQRMTVRVAINGFGRIGRNILRAIAESGRKDIEVVALNDLGPVETNAHLLRFDSVHGRFPGTVNVEGDTISHGNGKIKVCAERDPSKLPWKDLGVDIALECTGIFTAKDKASAHLTAGAKRVLVSAPADGADMTIVYGVNHDKLTKEHKVVSNGSCTTNCLAPVAKVLNDTVGIETRLHDHDPRLHGRPADARHDAQGSLSRPRGGALDDPDLDRRREGDRPRAAGAQGQARRRRDPRADAERLGGRSQDRRQEGDHRGGDQRRDEARRRAAAQGHPRLHHCSPNVSIDFNHDPHSSTFHMDQTKVMDGTLVR